MSQDPAPMKGLTLNSVPPEIRLMILERAVANDREETTPRVSSAEYLRDACWPEANTTPGSDGHANWNFLLRWYTQSYFPLVKANETNPELLSYYGIYWKNETRSLRLPSEEGPDSTESSKLCSTATETSTAVSLLSVFGPETRSVLCCAPLLRNASLDVLYIPSPHYSTMWTKWLARPAVVGSMYNIFRIQVRVMSADLPNVWDNLDLPNWEGCTQLPFLVKFLFDLGPSISQFGHPGGKKQKYQAMIRRIVVDVVPQDEDQVDMVPASFCRHCRVFSAFKRVPGRHTNTDGSGVDDDSVTPDAVPERRDISEREILRAAEERQDRHTKAAQIAADEFARGLEKVLTDPGHQVNLVNKVGAIEIRHKGDLIRSFDMSSSSEPQPGYEHFGSSWKAFRDALTGEANCPDNQVLARAEVIPALRLEQERIERILENIQKETALAQIERDLDTP